jgi:uncharacterized membrane protein
MDARFTPPAIWAYLRATYWFLPAVLTLASIVLALVLIALDRAGWDGGSLPGWVFGGGADGARALLSAVAGSTITVVSVTFSVTIVALTVSSQHFGPRLLNSFMRDTSAQAVLGIFISTFAYCLVVLRVVQGEGEDYERFVPHLAVTGALALTLVSVAALIYYVHHVAASLQVSAIARGVTLDLERAIDRLYPDQVGEDVKRAAAIPPVPDDAVAIHAIRSGYLQHTEPEAIVKLAAATDAVVWLDVRPGDFVTEGLPVARVHPRPARLDEFERELNAALVLGLDRTSEQDAGFPVQQLVEVSLHALSSGINEPFTAITCIDRLGQGLVRLAGRRLPSTVRADADGRPRIVAPGHTFAGLLGAAINPIRAHAAASPEVGLRLLVLLARLSECARRPDDGDAIRRHAELVRHAMARWIDDGEYGARIEALYQRCVRRTASG